MADPSTVISLVGSVGSGIWTLTLLPTPSAWPGPAYMLGAKPVRPWPMPNWKPPEPSIVVRLTPSVLTSERLTSANLTRRLTCSGVAIRSREMTLVSLPMKASTSRVASAPSSGEAIVPVSSTVLVPMVETAIFASGMATRSIWSTLSMFEPTRILADQITSPAALLA